MASLNRRWWFWHPYSDWSVKRRGKRDGLQTPPIPPWESKEQSPFLMQLKQAGDNDVRIISHQWSQLDRKLKTDWLNAEGSIKLREKHLASANEAEERACKTYEEVHKISPPAGGDRRLIGYAILIILLFVFEFPMNAIVFRLFGENEQFTAIATAAIALSLLASAHYLGVLLQERAVRGKQHTLGIIALIAAPALVICGVAYLREQYLKGASDTFGNLSPTMMWLAFVGFNVLIFIVATVGSYRVHDEALVAVYRARKRAAAAQQAHEEASKWLERAVTEREKQNDAFKTMADLVKDTVQRLTETYRTHNLEHRKDRAESHETAYPRSFYEYVEIAGPEALTIRWRKTGAVTRTEEIILGAEVKAAITSSAEVPKS